MLLAYRIPLTLLMLTSTDIAFSAPPVVYAVDSAASSVRVSTRESALPFDVALSDLAGRVSLGDDLHTPQRLDLVFDLSALRGVSDRYQWVERFPYGLAIASDVRATAAHDYEADATVALRNSGCFAPLAFQWTVAQEQGRSIGHLHGTTQINAQDFGIQGVDQWNAPITITYDLRLVPAAADAGFVTRHPADSNLTTEDYPAPHCAPAWSESALSPQFVRARQRPQD